MTLRVRHAGLLLLVLFALLWFGNLGLRPLAGPDEGRYAEIAREMAVSGDWVTPRLNGIKYFEKPPLQYWATALAFRLFGASEWTARLWTALTGFAGVLLAWYAGRRLFGAQSGLLAALVLGSAAFYVLGGHFASLDMGVSFFLQLTWTAFLLAQRAQDDEARRRWMLLAWAAAALALLSKGLIGLVLPGLALAVYVLLTRDFRLPGRLHLVPGLGLFLLVAAPWIVAVSWANPEFPRFFFVHEHFERFLTTTHRREAPWYIYVPLLLVGILPWLASLFPALSRAWALECGQTGFRPRLFLLVFSAVVLLFFSISRSKLPGYILPVFPALALLIGDALARSGEASLRRQFRASAAVLAALAVAALLLFPRHAQSAPELYQRYALWLAGGGALMALCLGAAWSALRRGARLSACLALAAGGLLMAQAVVTGHGTLAPINSGYDFARSLRPHLASSSRLYCVEMYDQTLTFYLQRTCTLVGYEDEMGFGLRQEPWLRGPDPATFLAHFPREPHAVAILRPERYERLKESGLPHRVLARDRKRVAIAPPASGT